MNEGLGELRVSKTLFYLKAVDKREFCAIMRKRSIECYEFAGDRIFFYTRVSTRCKRVLIKRRDCI